MWKRRASYDPMKAAAEGKKKMEEAKKMTQQQQSNFNDRCDAFFCLLKIIFFGSLFGKKLDSRKRLYFDFSLNGFVCKLSTDSRVKFVKVITY